ncbi:MAG: hypothetical protein MUE88_02055 [Flavobacteriales bacterium]|jgi:hypothetical protein|nr:hypothetical protein [Flavobacteriales bacterium]
MIRVLLLLLCCSPLLVSAQTADDVAYVPHAAPERTADDTRLGLAPGAVAGSLDLQLPRGTEAVELLNGRGDVEHRLAADQWDHLPLDLLRPGTWTLRARVNGRYLVRRFLVLGNGHSTWLPDPVQAKAPRRKR